MTKLLQWTRCAMSLPLEECTPGLVLRDIWKERKLTEECETIIYILSFTQVFPHPSQDLRNEL